MISPQWRVRLFAIAGTVLAVVLGVCIANEAFVWPIAVVGGLLALIFIYIQPHPLPTILLGGAVFGYIVGNRGFAQFSFSSAFPLFPAELVLLVCGAFLVVQCAWRHELPFRSDMLNTALLLWMLVGTIRLLYGVRLHGFAAIRDYALVYYAGFFFLVQYAARDPASARFLRGSLLVACGALAVIHPIYSQFPDFFVRALSIRGVPLIFFKDDLAGNFMSVGSLLFFLRYERTRSAGWFLLSLVLAGLMLMTSSRSSMVGLAIGALWLAVGRRWRFAGTLAAGAVVAAIVVFMVAEARNQSWRQTPLHRVYERVVSIADPLGQRSYQTDDAFKGDNNVFRMVWWRAAVTETLETNRWFGLGFGHDLAARFVRQYLPDSTEDFTARSPHNVLITVFARMGIVGLALFLSVISAMAVKTWRAVRDSRLMSTAGGAWCSAWVLLVCACFGVVLEGPMGAVVFWSMLGLANAETVPVAVEEPAPVVGELAELA
ncbi:MAG TPA: O-antigen ligase family protein [Opitutaceae bacterium]|nr:O-antigen ligase family protein [Opitutaceae bacterium]